MLSCCMKKPLDAQRISITIEYEFTTTNRDVTEEILYDLLDNEPITEVLSLVNTQSRSDWKTSRKEVSTSVEQIE